MPAPSTPLTSTEQAEEVLRQLGEIGAADEADAADAALVKRHLQGAYNAWYLRGKATWTFEALPPEALRFLNVVIARVRPHFQGTDPMKVPAEERMAEMMFNLDNPQPEMTGETWADY